MFMFTRHLQVKPGHSAEAAPELIDLISRANSITGRSAIAAQAAPNAIQGRRRTVSAAIAATAISSAPALATASDDGGTPPAQGR